MRDRANSFDSPHTLKFQPANMSRSVTEVVKRHKKIDVPAEETNMFFDKNDGMGNLLKVTQTEQKTQQMIETETQEAKSKERELLGDIPKEMLTEWNGIISESEDLKASLKQGKIDEKTLRARLGVNDEDEQACKWVDNFLMNEEPNSAVVMPILTSWKEIKELFGSGDDCKNGAPEYWQTEGNTKREERARLIKVGVDIPAIWAIEDAAQEITADLYITFTWKVAASRKAIWDRTRRDFIKPIWKIRLRSGKFINNLNVYSIMDDEISCGDEKDGQSTIIQRITMTATFSQNFDLRRFPFDTQTISFTIRYWLIPYLLKAAPKRGRLIFYEDIAWNCRVKENALKPSDEWEICRPKDYDGYDRLKFISTLTNEKLDPKNGRRWPEISFSFEIKRNPEFMKWNTAVPITMTVLFGLIGNLTAFNSDFDRTSFTAALLFTIFSIKNNVQYALSKVGYRTTLDNYILLSQAMIIVQGAVGVCFSHVSNFKAEDEELGEDWSDYLLPGFFGILGLICWGYVTFRFWRGKTLIY